MELEMMKPQRWSDWLGRRAIDRANEIALETSETSLTYRSLYQIATQAAYALRQMGIEPGQRVALYCTDTFVFAQMVHVCIQASVMIVPLNLRLTAVELAWQVENAGCVAVIHDSTDAETVGYMTRTANVSVLHVNEFLLQNTKPTYAVQRIELHAHEPLAMIFTSGTTGNPKGAVITFGNQWWSAINSALHFGMNPNDRWLVPMPLFHVGGLSVLMRSVIYGSTAVIQQRFDPDAVNHALDHGGITLVSVVPAMLQRMLQERTRSYTASLRVALLGGSSAPEGILDAALRAHLPIAPTYGLTEANSQVTTLRPSEVHRKKGSSGNALFSTEVGVMTDQGIKSLGGEGEIVVRGPTVIPGYYHRPDANEKSFLKDGWFRTGDIGYIDEEGYLYVRDRRTDLIVSGGENVYPAEIESVLSTHPNVIESGVIGRSDPVWGEVPVAYVVTSIPERELTDTLRAHCLARLAKYKVPTEFIPVPQLPRNASGKLLRRTLREWVMNKPPSL